MLGYEKSWHDLRADCSVVCFMWVCQSAKVTCAQLSDLCVLNNTHLSCFYMNYEPRGTFGAHLFWVWVRPSLTLAAFVPPVLNKLQTACEDAGSVSVTGKHTVFLHLHSPQNSTVRSATEGSFAADCGSVCFHDFPSIPGSAADCLSGLRVCSCQWQLEWYGLYTALTCIIGHIECSVQCQCQCCHSDKAVVSCWRLTDLALHQRAWTYSPWKFWGSGLVRRPVRHTCRSSARVLTPTVPLP